MSDYWDTVTPEEYEAAPALDGWPWCEPGWFPVDYTWEAECVPQDPCSSDGATTLWRLTPCELETTTTVAEPVVAARPAQLPATGLSEVLVVGALVLVTAGVALRRVATR